MIADIYRNEALKVDDDEIRRRLIEHGVEPTGGEMAEHRKLINALSAEIGSLLFPLRL